MKTLLRLAAESEYRCRILNLLEALLPSKTLTFQSAMELITQYPVTADEMLEMVKEGRTQAEIEAACIAAQHGMDPMMFLYIKDRFSATPKKEWR